MHPHGAQSGIQLTRQAQRVDPEDPTINRSQGGLAVQVRNVTFSYRSGPEILRMREFQIERGERVFLYGPSGCGKTTLLGLIAGVLRVNPGGELRVLDQDLGRMSNHRRDAFRGAHIGYIFQLFNLIPYLNVRDNITLPCRLSNERRHRLGGRDLAESAEESAAQLGVGGLLSNDVTKLSVGQQQRVAAARALLGNPQLIIADEPTSALDFDQREQFLFTLFERSREQGATLIFVSHDRSLAPLFDRSVSLLDINEISGY
jgi:putative ABC transport system ATP-binding protein